MKAPARFDHRRHGNRYPWDEWFARSAVAPVRLVQGRDFSTKCLPSSLAVMLRTRMAGRGLYRTVIVRGDMVTIGPSDPNYSNRGPERKPHRA